MKKLAIAIAIILVFAINWGLSGGGSGSGGSGHARINGYQQGNPSALYDQSTPAADAGVYGRTEGWSGAPN